MHDGGVVAATKVATDLLQAEPGVPPSQPHADLPRNRDRLVTPLAQQVGQFHVVVAGHRLDDGLDRRGRSILTGSPGGVVREGFLGKLKGDRFVFSQRETTNSREGPLQLADIGVQPRRDVRRGASA